MILDPGASRLHGDFDRRCHASAQRRAAGPARKGWLACVAVLAVVATVTLWLVGHAVPNGGPIGAAPLEAPRNAGAAAAAGFTTATTGTRPASLAVAAPATSFAVDPLSEADVRLLQAKLAALGYAPGYVDGVAGGRTLDALNLYRESKHLERAFSIRYSTVADLLD